MKYPTKTLGIGESCRKLKPNEAFKCPWCGRPMQPHDGPWAVVHCVPCQRSIDLWYDEPQVMQAEVEPHKPEQILVDPKTLTPVDPETVWTDD